MPYGLLAICGVDLCVQRAVARPERPFIDGQRPGQLVQSAHAFAKVFLGQDDDDRIATAENGWVGQ
jgi:hypothetical protein